ncbi:MAG: discoidin domain-containing protein [Candidatus Omnitrophica bacterium]|nr:discoidin domain-containing protein [Candidatus Omnitrophota bacterium]
MKTLVVEILKDAAQWKISTFYKSESIGHRHYSIWKASESNIEVLCSDIFSILNRVDFEGKVTANSLGELRKSSHLLYNQVFPQEIKEELHKTDASHLIFYIDEQLVRIPWELLYDGSNYMCNRFAVGRIVLTSSKIHSESIRSIQPKLKMLTLCDPAGDLKKAYEEGIVIRNILDKAKEKIDVDLRTTDVELKYALKNLKEYDVFHFAGHAKYDKTNPAGSGLVFKDASLTADQIAALSGSSSMPVLVFANACSSGETEQWEIEPAQNIRIYGLANAFLLAGVKHYIGTFWKIQDNLSMEFAREFYTNVIKGKSVGEALRLSRTKLIEKFGETSLIWASYMLYGDPEDHLIFIDKEEKKRKIVKIRIISGICFAFLVLIGIVTHRSFFVDSKPKSEIKFESFKNVFYVDTSGNVTAHDVMAIFNRNIALKKNVYSSSEEGSTYSAINAVDGSYESRWSSVHKDPQWIYVDLGDMCAIGQIRLAWEAAFGRYYFIQVSNDARRWKTVWKTWHGTSGKDVIDLKDKDVVGRYVRLYGKRRGTDWGYSLWEMEIYSKILPNVAVHKSAIASSGDGYYAAEQAVDDDMGTRWGSQYLDPQWISIDLGSEHSVNMITLFWERAYGKRYKIQHSNDKKDWVDACVINNENNLLNTIYFETPFTARYIRLYGMERSTKWGYSLWEFRIHGIKLP